ncbi:MAG: hypothetical protein Q4C44_03425 [bacterium]|nr:hypothetical protein [bacterium]
MKYIKKYKVIIIALLICLLLPVTITFSRYLYTKVLDYILESNNFFFNSDKLTSNNKIYEINNWSGTDPFTIDFELNNRKNNLLYSNSDIEYSLDVECANETICSITNETGVIYKNQNSVLYSLTINPTRVFNANEVVTVKVNAKSLSPYIKKLAATFRIKVGVQGLSHEIKDTENQAYFMFNITNTRQSYFARNAFGNYNVGDEIISDDYLALSDADKANFSSARITLSFDPSKVILDTTSNITEKSTKLYTTVDNVSYISSITFDIDAVSSTAIRFYKKDPKQNYTYPIINNTSIINFSAI